MTTNVHRLARDLDALGVELPGPLADVAALRAALGTLAAESPVNGFEAELLDGRISATNAVERVKTTAAALAAYERAVEVARSAEPGLAKLERRALATSGDTIVTALRPAFDTAVGDLAAFVERFGPDPRPEDVLAAPGGSEAWQARDAALTFFDRCRRVCHDLLGPYYGPDAPSWYLADVNDAEHLKQARAVFSSAARGFVDLLAAGYRLRLNTNEEAEALVAKVRTESAARTAAAEAERQAAKARVKAERQRIEDESIEQRRAMLQRAGLAS